MAINLLCQSCKSSMKIGTKKCSKCGQVLTGSHRLYRVRVKLPSGRWKSKTVPNMVMANKIELQYKTKGVEEDTMIQIDAPRISKVWPDYLKWAKVNKRSWENDEMIWRVHIKSHFNDVRMDRVVPHHIQSIVNVMYAKKKPDGSPYDQRQIFFSYALNHHKCNRKVTIASRIMLPKTKYNKMWRVYCEVSDEFSCEKRIIG